jgi:hypothetical protein
MGKFIDLTGQRFGRLEVKGKSHKNKKGQWLWFCHCDCGNDTIVIGTNLYYGFSQSCGCFQREEVKERMTKHGFSKTPIEQVRNSMMKRCYNPKNAQYKDYGGRGITVCEEWRTNPVSFYIWAIQTGYDNTRHNNTRNKFSLDRINNDGPYSPDNCRWATRTEQGRNKRSNHLITYNGEAKTMKEWSEITGVSYSTLRSRKNSGWSDEKTIATPKLETWSRYKH